jgi:outer membrane protein
VACLIIGIAGCKVDQQKEVATHRKVVDLSPTTQPVWAPGTPLTLVQAMLLANAQNERLSIQGEDYLQAIIARKHAVANFLPTLNLTGVYGWAENVGDEGRPNHALDVAAVGQMNLFNGFRDVATLKVADLTIEQQHFLLRDAQESLLADTVRVYFLCLRNEALIGVLENSVALQNERLRDTAAREKAGLARSLDVAQAQAQVSQTGVLLINARVAAKNSRSALALITAAPVETVTLRDLPIKVTLPADVANARATAMQDRQDLLAAGKDRDAARQAVEVAVGEYYPSISVNVTGFLTRQSVPTDRDWLTLFQANLPIFSAGQIEADVRNAWSIYRQRALFESLLRRQINSDVEVTFNNLQSSTPRLDGLRVQESAAQQAVASARGLALAGVGRPLEEFVAQDQLLNARLELTNETYVQRVYATDLIRATGRLRATLETQLSAPTTQEAKP